MTDKEKFRKEVEKLKSNLIHGACSSQVAMETMCKEEVYNEVLAILDTMQEEPVSEKKCMFTKDSYTDEDRKVLCKDCKEKCEYSKKEEPVSEDLEDAADNALSNVLNAHEIVNVGSCLEMFKFGAKWQKEQMMAKAVDGEVTYGKSLAIPSLGWVLYKEGLDFGDKVKLVIIKED